MNRQPSAAAFAWLAVVVSVATGGSDAVAFNQYSTNGGNDPTGYCASCHGDFNGPNYTSLADGTPWGNDLMFGHRSNMLSGDCNTCHQNGPNFPVLTNDSAGGTGLLPIGCVGCHGREQDNTPANPEVATGLGQGRGAGLRRHHFNAGIATCAVCHLDADPNEFPLDPYMPVGEDVLPAYYFIPDTNHPDKPVDPCNPFGSESVFGALGLDNDGDGLYDGDDPDCVPAFCGDGNTDVDEDCDDAGESATCDVDCTFVSCGDTTVNTTAGEDCDDGNGVDGDDCTNLCLFALCGDAITWDQGSGSEECDDGDGSDNNDCTNSCTSAFCGDGLVWDAGLGTEECDTAGADTATCNAGTCLLSVCGDNYPNAADGEQCDDGNTTNGDGCTDTCQIEGCGNGVLEPPEECDDGSANSDTEANACRTDCTLPACGDDVVDLGETCDPISTCPSDCDDDIACTIDELTGSAAACNAVCSNTIIVSCENGDGCCPAGCNSTVDDDCPDTCDDGVIDPGETCDPLSTCPTDCNDGDACTADALAGNPTSCTAECVSTPIVACVDDDGCCPASCDGTTDSDCEVPDDGCACRAPGSGGGGTSTGTLLLIAGALWFGVVRRRRRAWSG